MENLITPDQKADIDTFIAFVDGVSQTRWYLQNSADRDQAAANLRILAKKYNTEWRLRGLKRAFHKTTFLRLCYEVVRNEEVRG